MEIRSLEKTGVDKLFSAFSEAFRDYEMQLDRAEWEAMLERRGFSPGLSFAAFEQDRIVAFTLNGIGQDQGVPTAYDTGTATLPEFRGQGLATKIFEHAVPLLKQAGIGRYLLEVLQHNQKAVSVYRKLGFGVSRELHYFRQQNRAVRLAGTVADPTLSVVRLDPAHVNTYRKFWDFTPSWQNSLESLTRVPDSFICLGVTCAGEVVGYAVFEPSSGDITQIAVGRAYRRMGIASLLLREMVQLNRNEGIKVINAEISCQSVTRFLESRNIPAVGKQFEMVKNL